MGNAPGRDFRCCAFVDSASFDQTLKGNIRGPSPAVIPDERGHHTEIPQVLLDFLEAREIGNVEDAVACCTTAIMMKGPMGSFTGIQTVKSRAFAKPSQPLGKILMTLQYQPMLSSPEVAMYAREFEAHIGYSTVPLRQEFGVVNSGTSDAKVCLVVFKKLVTLDAEPPLL